MDSCNIPNGEVLNPEILSLGTYYVLILIGCFAIFNFVISEYRLGKRKQDSMNRCRRSHKIKTSSRWGSSFHFSWRELFHYRLGYYYSNHQWAKPTFLLSATFLLIVVGAIALYLVGEISLSASTWISWTYVADPGTHADAEGMVVRLVSFIISIGGMLVFALMIGIVSEDLGAKVDDLKQGKARVI